MDKEYNKRKQKSKHISLDERICKLKTENER